MEKAQFFFENYIQEKAESFTALPQSGSARINYIAETSKGKFVITQNENIRENEAFFYFSEVFSSLNLNTPKIFKISDDRKTYIQEHLGEKTFSEIIAEEGLNSRTENLVKQYQESLKPKSAKKSAKSFEVNDDSKKNLAEFFGAKIEVKATNGKGKIIIPFHSEEDFNRLLKLIENK